jgi:hypothetical protein
MKSSREWTEEEWNTYYSLLAEYYEECDALMRDYFEHNLIGI